MESIAFGLTLVALLAIAVLIGIGVAVFVVCRVISVVLESFGSLVPINSGAWRGFAKGISDYADSVEARENFVNSMRSKQTVPLNSWTPAEEEKDE